MLDDTNRGKTSLEPFLLLAKNARGAAAAQLIRQVCEAPGVYVFGELLQVDGIKELMNNPDYSKDWKLLQLYAFGTYSDYTANTDNFPELSDSLLKKLRLLTIATLASKSKYVPYKVLQEKLELQTLREIEDLIIQAVYSEVLKGKLNQREQRLEVEFVIGRDIQEENIDCIINTLKSWCETCEQAMLSLETQSIRANSFKESKTSRQKAVDQEVENVKKAMKTQEMNSAPLDIDIDSTIQQQQKSFQKLKGLKSTGKASSSRTR